MEISQNPNITNHRLELLCRSELRVSGVSDVHSFNDEGILLETSMGLLTVGGSDMKITKLNLEQGEVSLRGEITSLVYNDSFASSGSKTAGIMSRLFR